MPYRVACPPDAPQDEVEDPFAAVLRAQRRRARWLTVLGALAVAAIVVKVAPSRADEQRRRPLPTVDSRQAGARAAIASARTRAYAAQWRFEHAMRAAIGEGAAPRPELGACPIVLPMPSVEGRAAFPLLTVDHVEIAGTLPSQAIAGVLKDVARAEAHLAAGRFEEATLYARALDRPERFGYDVVLVTSAHKVPHALSGSAYEPGAITGRAYLFDFARSRVVCSGDITARSTTSIGYVYSDRPDTPSALSAVTRMNAALEADFHRETESAIVMSLSSL